MQGIDTVLVARSILIRRQKRLSVLTLLRTIAKLSLSSAFAKKHQKQNGIFSLTRFLQKQQRESLRLH